MSSSLELSQAGVLGLTGLLASGLKKTRGSLVGPGPLPWRSIPGDIGNVGDAIDCSPRGYCWPRGEDAAACRRREGALWRGGYLGDGSAGGSGGLFDGEGLYVGRGYAGWCDDSIWRFAGCFDRIDPKPFFAAGRAYGFIGCGDAGGVNSACGER
jgi:hypothetical protein